MELPPLPSSPSSASSSSTSSLHIDPHARTQAWAIGVQQASFGRVNLPSFAHLQGPAPLPSMHNVPGTFADLFPAKTKARKSSTQSRDFFELNYEQLLCTPATSSQSETRNYGGIHLKAPNTVLPKEVRALRLYLPAECRMIPFAWLEDFNFYMGTSFPALTEVDICFRSLLTPLLEEVHNQPSCNDAMCSMLLKWESTPVSLETFFRRVEAKNDEDDLQNFRLVPLLEVVLNLDGAERLSEILAEESTSSSSSPHRLEASECMAGIKMFKGVSDDDELL